MFDERAAGAAAAAADYVYHTRRQAGVDECLHEVVDGDGRIGGGLDDAGVAGNERREELPAGDGHGEVPRRDQADNAYGHANAHGELVLEFRGRGLAKETAAFSGNVKRFVNGFLHVAAGFGEHLAHLARHVAGVLFFALLQQDTGPEKYLGALGCGNEATGGKGFLGGSYGRIHVFRP